MGAEEGGVAGCAGSGCLSPLWSPLKYPRACVCSCQSEEKQLGTLESRTVSAGQLGPRRLHFIETATAVHKTSARAICIAQRWHSLQKWWMLELVNLSEVRHELLISNWFQNMYSYNAPGWRMQQQNNIECVSTDSMQDPVAELYDTYLCFAIPSR